MIDDNWLSNDEEALLKQHNPLLDSVRRGRIIKKVKKSLATLDIVATFGKIDYDKLWSDYKITSFLRALIRHDSSKTPIDENTKLSIAGNLIKIGLEYYTDAFKNMKIHSSKVKEMNETINAINEVIQIESREKNYSKLYSMRKPLQFIIPDVRTFGSDTDWKARCDICWRYATGTNKQEAMKKIRHHDYCNYDKKDPEYCIRTFEPRIKN